MLTATTILARYRSLNPLPEPVTATKVLAKLPKPVTAGARAMRIARLALRASELVRAGAGDIPLSVKCVVLNSVGRVLLLKDSESEFWDLPGGHLRKGECALAGLEREVREETGMAIGDIQSCSSHELDYGKRKQVTQFFLAGTVSDTVTLSKEHDSFEWVDPAELGNYNLGLLLEPARRCLPKPALLMASHQRTPPTFPGREAQDSIRNKARSEYERAVARLVAVAEADAIAKRQEDETKRKKRDKAFLLLAALLLLDAGRRIYRASGKKLAELAEHAPDETGATLPVGRHAAAPMDTEPSAEEVEAFIQERGPLLENFPSVLQERLEQAATDAAVGAGHEQDVSAAILKAGQEIEAGQGRVVAETESQAVYGHAQLRALKRGGFITARWETMGDDRVRESHELCATVGEVKLGDKYPNGNIFPGDPNGSVAENANCRCWLVGVRREASRV